MLVSCASESRMPVLTDYLRANKSVFESPSLYMCSERLLQFDPGTSVFLPPKGGS